ncbi:glycerophosphoryl diester phosphodiesterase [Sneathiella glossodoripedis]|uniref:glycerophosphoryl diester phosphodiesterase n=1 Tax=Sneathiella glossodoripedis TaxID=418853 RepID=UPI00046F9745|nr:glycerophosphoryl diester phosphodiesterase [Sneathiella glossodoripedis]
MQYPYFNNMPRIIAHRGASGLAPENTLAAIDLAAKLGIRSVEIDVMITADNQCVICHDHNVRRCTNGEGKVRLKTLSEIKELDAGSWFSSEFKGEKIPTLSEAMKLIAEREMSVNLEIKPLDGWQVPTAEIVCAELKRLQSQLPPLLISSFNIESLQVVNKLLPDVPIGYLSDTLPHNWKERLSAVNAASLHMDCDFINRDIVNEVHEASIRLLTYTLNDPAKAKQFLGWGVDGIITDFPDRMSELS